jgi:glycosyltransferase involved in cell wall biosynthesis
MRSYIVIVSPLYGGAEKRFFDIFVSLRRYGIDVAIVAPSSLVDQFKADYPDRDDVFSALTPVVMSTWSRLGFVLRFRRLLRTISPGCSFHYPLNCLWPLHLGRGDKVSMSVVDCTRVPGLFGGTRTILWTWLAFFFVRQIDVLNPTIFSEMRNYRAAKKMSLTPGGTFLVPSPPVASPRFPTVVFLGRLVSGKGVDDFLDVLPDVWALLLERAPKDVSFQIAGYGSLQKHVDKRVAALARSGVPIVFVGYAAAHELLARAAVLLSMQESTNYPSRVVGEALIAGCGVIVRDTGDSREFGQDLPGLVYCHARLDAREIADQLAMLLDRIMIEPGFSDEVRNTALAKFSSKRCIDYFRDVMSSVAT